MEPITRLREHLRTLEQTWEIGGARGLLGRLPGPVRQVLERFGVQQRAFNAANVHAWYAATEHLAALESRQATALNAAVAQILSLEKLVHRLQGEAAQSQRALAQSQDALAGVLAELRSTLTALAEDQRVLRAEFAHLAYEQATQLETLAGAVGAADGAQLERLERLRDVVAQLESGLESQELALLEAVTALATPGERRDG